MNKKQNKNKKQKTKKKEERRKKKEEREDAGWEKGENKSDGDKRRGKEEGLPVPLPNNYHYKHHSSVAFLWEH